MFLQCNISIPDTDFSRHPACLTPSAAKCHQGVIQYGSLNAIGQSHVCPHGSEASWHKGQAAVFPILIYCIAVQCNRTNATKSTDKYVTAAGAKASAPLSCLDVCSITACTWLVGDYWVWHIWRLDLISAGSDLTSWLKKRKSAVDCKRAFFLLKGKSLRRHPLNRL